MGITLRMTGMQHANLQAHVMAEDGFEAGSLLFCEPVFRGENTILLVQKIKHIPYDACTQRTPVYLSWPTENMLMPEYEHIEREGLTLIMLHGHPNGFEDFSLTDNQNDLKILPRLHTCIEGQQPHGSAIMLPDGKIIGKVIDNDNQFLPIEKIAIAGNEIRFFGDFLKQGQVDKPDYAAKTEQVYGSATTNIMQGLTIGIVGGSGTGSPTIELLLRYLAGVIVIIDSENIEEGNLNRMMTSRVKDVAEGKLKVERCAEWIAETGLPVRVVAINGRVPSEETTKALSECDVIFGCVDNVTARYAINTVACAYLIPYFDLGVAIIPDKRKPKELRQAIARCHYIQPDQSCLLDREAFSAERLRDENFRRDDPAFYKELKKAGYTDDSDDIQAVMTITMKAAVMGVDDLMARLHGYRVDPNKEFDEQEHSFTHGYYLHRKHACENIALRYFLAQGDKHLKF